jgi:hypothetical protein
MNNSWLVDKSLAGKKRRRVINQLQDGIISPPQNVNKVEIKSCDILAICPSKSFVKSGQHDVRIWTEDNKFKFECDCNGKFGEQKVNSCYHINTIVLKLMTNYVESSVKIADNKEEYLKMKESVKDLMNSLEKLEIK